MAENLAWLCVGLFPICVTLALPVALIAIVGGLAGLVADRRRKGLMWLVSLFVLGVGACMLLVLVGNRFSPEPSPPTSWPKYHIMDEQMEPFVSAISVVDPTSLGFTPIPADAWGEISPYPNDIYITSTRKLTSKRWGIHTSGLGKQSIMEGQARTKR